MVNPDLESRNRCETAKRGGETRAIQSVLVFNDMLFAGSRSVEL